MSQSDSLVSSLEEYWLAEWIPHRGEVFVDVGANIGNWTKLLARTYGTVHAIEPHQLALNSLKDGLPSNVVVHETAVWSYRGTIEFHEFEKTVHLSAYFVHEGINTGPRCGSIEIPCSTIDDLAIDGRVTFLKCDTEGAEVHCLLGAENTIRTNRPWLLLEIHSNDNFATITHLLRSWNYMYTIVRHPYYERFGRLWNDHCWLICQHRAW